MDKWLRKFPASATPSVRLVCLPHAGGTAGSFAGWRELLPATVELVAVQYPGRQDRLGDAPIEEMAQIADEVTSALLPLLDLPLVLFGHSMGSGLAYEVAGRLERDHGFQVDRIFVSARPAPHRIDGEHRHRLSDEDLVAAMRGLGGPDAEVYDHPALLPLILPPLRADLRLLDRYRPEQLDPVSAPITAFGGESDETCPVAELASWQDATSAHLSTRIFPGGHHYLRECAQDVVETICLEIAPAPAH
jgi:surfactin synthase thioesterase subunit